MKPIYIPKGKAKEFGDYAINIYTGCPHECYYCFAPNVLRRDREKFHTNVAPREGIVEAVKKQIERENKIKEVCLTCKKKKCSGSRKCFEKARKANIDKASQK